MGLVDSHAHLTFEPLCGQVREVLDRASAAGVDRVISIAIDMGDAQWVVELARSDERVSAAIGIHPHEAGKATQEDWASYRQLMSNPAVVALGEMGLDYHYDYSDRPTQRAVFERRVKAFISRGE